MKFLFAILTLVPTLAQAAPLTCSNGDISEIGDRHIQITLNPGRMTSLEVDEYETSYSALPGEVVTNGNSFAILDQTLEASSEGTEFKMKVNALLVYNPENKTLNTTLITDGSTRSEILNCK